MSRITDMFISAILKRGVLYEARNCELEFNIPSTKENAKGEDEDINILIKCKIEHMTVKVEKGQVVQ